MNIANTCLRIYRLFFATINPLLSFTLNPPSRILIYHLVSSNQHSAFKEQMQFLTDNFEIITAGQFIDLFIYGKVDNQSRYCCITFDDGFDNILEFAIPTLLKFNIRATIFLNYNLYYLTKIQDFTALSVFCHSKFPRLFSSVNNLQGLTFQQLRDLISSGFEIGAHTVNHPSVAHITQNQLKHEFSYPIKQFHKEFNYDLKLLAYPYGRRNDINTLAKSTARECGYKAAFSGISRPIGSYVSDFMEIPRTSINLNWSFKYFSSSLLIAEDLKDFFSTPKVVF